MDRKKSKKPVSNIMQFKIMLNDSSPRIWRRTQVPADYTFFDLHCAIQDAMGWADCHLHAFYIEERGKDRLNIEFPDPEKDEFYLPGEAPKSRDERQERIADYFGKRIKQCIYLYDLGDNWDHTVLFERTLPADSKTKYPCCVSGENACPPENCGGIGGYERLQKIIGNPDHNEHEELMEWMGFEDPSEFDPHEFDLSEIIFQTPKKRLREWNKGFGMA